MRRDSAKDIPGPVGDIATVARGTTSAGTGGTFDSEGNFQELSTGQVLRRRGSEP